MWRIGSRLGGQQTVCNGVEVVKPASISGQTEECKNGRKSGEGAF